MIIPNVLKLEQPQKPLPLIFDSPHSGRIMPPDFHPNCTADDITRTADLYVDDLFSTAPDHGASLLTALFPRSYLDVNRASDDIDPELYDGDWPQNGHFKNFPANPTNRSYAGIGLIRRLLKPGQPLYDSFLTPDQICQRIETYHRPYHQTLETLINEAHYNYGASWHINCHSMPSASAQKSIKQGAMARVNPFIAPDIVLGDRDGTSCDLAFTKAVRAFFTEKGYQVAVNDPYKGVELVDRYSAPAQGRHSLQIEISRALYLNEENYKKSKTYDKVQSDMNAFVHFCATYAKDNLPALAAD
jgi:N-formylglutamate amidohydrolase